MANVYQWFAALVGYDPSATQDPTILLASCVCVTVLFVASIKLVSRAFTRLGNN